MDWPELNVDGEWRDIQGAVAGMVVQGRLQLDRIDQPTPQQLIWRLRGDESHVLHFVGHGTVDTSTGDGNLILTDQYGRGRPISSTVIGPLVHDLDSLQLIVPNACKSASSSVRHSKVSLAETLASAGTGALIAMQAPVSDAAARSFASEFYQGLMAAAPLGQVLSWTRKSLLVDQEAAWPTPALSATIPESLCSGSHARDACPPPSPGPDGPGAPFVPQSLDQWRIGSASRYADRRRIDAGAVSAPCGMGLLRSGASGGALGLIADVHGRGRARWSHAV